MSRKESSEKKDDIGDSVLAVKGSYNISYVECMLRTCGSGVGNIIG